LINLISFGDGSNTYGINFGNVEDASSFAAAIDTAIKKSK